MRTGCTDHRFPSKNLYYTNNFSALLLPRHFQVSGSTQEFPAQTSAGMTNTSVQARSRGIEDNGKGQTHFWWIGLARKREGQAEGLCVPVGGCWSRHLGYVLNILEWEHFIFMCGERGGFQQSGFQTFFPLSDEQL